MKSISILLFLWLTSTASAQFGGAVQQARVPEDLVRRIYRSQQRPATCWAACNSMLLASIGIASSEEDQIRRMSSVMPNGGLGGAGPHFLNAQAALQGNYNGNQVNVWFRDRRMNDDPQMNQEFVSVLRRGSPVMIATPQHGMIAIAVQFRVYPNGFHELLAVEVLDPNPTARRRWLPTNEFMHVFGFMAAEGSQLIRAR